MREKIASEEAAIRLNRKRAERQAQQLEQKLATIEQERAQILAQAKAEAQAELAAIRGEIAEMRRKVRDAQSMNQMKQLSKNVELLENQPRAGFRAEPLVAPEAREAGSPRPRMLKVGDTVRLKSWGTQGEVLRISGDEAEVAMGRLHTRVPLAELEFKGRPVATQDTDADPAFVPSASPQTAGIIMPTAVSPGMELDLRGQRVEEGLQKLDKYLDAAERARLPWVRIIHGKGTGRMRTAVREALDGYTAVLSWEEGQDGEGGPGVTVAHLEKP
jgi:DNA mismatch repair protein MutS2